MPVIKLNMDQRTYEALVKVACADERSVPGQAIILIRRALGVPPLAAVGGGNGRGEDVT
jgi:hypothetical protein